MMNYSIMDVVEQIVIAVAWIFYIGLFIGALYVLVTGIKLLIRGNRNGE